MKPLLVRFPPKLRTIIKKHADHMGISEAAYIRLAVYSLSKESRFTK